MVDVDEREVWRRVCEGDAEAFATVFNRYADEIYGYCFRRTGDWTAAEDLMSAVFLETWRRRSHLRSLQPTIRPWLFAIATNVLRNRLRSLRRYRAALQRVPPLDYERDFADDLGDRIDAAERARPLIAELRRLPAREREVFALCAWQGLSSTEVATALGIREGTVRARLFRARRRLRSHDAARRQTPETTNVQGVIHG